MTTDAGGCIAWTAGELMELQSTLAGTTWTTASTNLAATSCGGGLVRSGSQYVLNDLFGRVAQARDSSGTLVASATYDVFGVQRTGSGAFAAGIIRKTYGGNNEDGLNVFLRLRVLRIASAPGSYVYPGWPVYDGRWSYKYWGYGNWCGRFRGGGPTGNAGPINEIDGCCMVHDFCLNSLVVTPECSTQLCKCLNSTSCNGDAKCQSAKRDMWKWFCNVFTLPAVS